MAGTSLPAGCQMLTSASVQTEGLGSGFLPADAVLRAVLRVSGAHISRERQRTPSLSTPPPHTHTHIHQEAAQEPGHLTCHYMQVGGPEGVVHGGLRADPWTIP